MNETNPTDPADAPAKANEPSAPEQTTPAEAKGTLDAAKEKARAAAEGVKDLKEKLTKHDLKAELREAFSETKKNPSSLWKKPETLRPGKDFAVVGLAASVVLLLLLLVTSSSFLGLVCLVLGLGALLFSALGLKTEGRKIAIGGSVVGLLVVLCALGQTFGSSDDGENAEEAMVASADPGDANELSEKAASAATPDIAAEAAVAVSGTMKTAPAGKVPDQVSTVPTDTSKMDAARLRGECEANEGAVTLDVREIMEDAKDAKKQKSLNFCGFYTGMSFANAKRLADHYGMERKDYSFHFNPLTGEVVHMYFSPRAMDLMLHTSSDYDMAEVALMGYLGISEWSLDAGDMGGYYNSPNGISVELSKPKWGLGSHSAVSIVDSGREKEYYKVAPRFYNNKLVVEKQKEIEACGARNEVLETPGGVKLLMSMGGNKLVKDENWREMKHLLFGSFELTETQWEAITGKKVKNPRGFNYPVTFGESGIERRNETFQWSMDAFNLMLNSMSYVQKWNRFFQTLKKVDTQIYPMFQKDEDQGYFMVVVDDGELGLVSEKDYDSFAWLKGNSGGGPHPVASKRPNAHGLYDTIGNMAEIVDGGCYGGDCYDKNASDCDRIILPVGGHSDSIFPRLTTIRLRSNLTRDSYAHANARGVLLPGNILLPMVEIPEMNNLWVGTFEVTRGQWKALMGSVPKDEGEMLGEAILAADTKRLGIELDEHDLLPVSNVSWYDCQRFLEKLNALPATKAEGIVFDLPTAEEWRYAASGGSNGPYGDGITGKNLSQYAWFRDDSGDVVKQFATRGVNEVGWKTVNKFVLFDMLGNAAEWTSSSSGDKKVVCGGNGDKAPTASECEVTFRCLRDPGSNGRFLGLRLVARKNPPAGMAVSTDSSQ